MNGFSSEAQTMSLMAFIAVITVTLLLCVMTGPDRDDLGEFYTGYRSLTPMQSGLAIAGDYISAGTVLGTIGIIALLGYDGLTLTLSTVLSLVLMMFLLAEPLRNAGRFTMGDVFGRRAPGPVVRITAAAVTLTALLPLVIFQLAGAGDLLAVVLGFHADGFKTGSIVFLGLLMITYAAIGGMKGTAFIQIVKTVVLLGAATVIAVLILERFDFSPPALLDAAKEGSGLRDAYLTPGLQFGGDGLDMVSTQLTVVLGAAVLPHITMRMFTARNARAVRRSMSWAVSIVVVACLLIAV
ncbi:sodium:solute symporter family transporter, partial [Streptomyces pristinaespiralis]|uniref:sodium:solute symporter family transporter n=1 Tax=Streptomyces pristinaespiralis TaxID=38300 RepID=UPI000566D02D